MPRVRSFKQDREAIKDMKISVCTDCRWGIFPDHKFKWTRTKGLVHIDCADKRGVNAIKNASRALSQPR